MGANMIPIVKKRGKTVLGVNMGLRATYQYKYADRLKGIIRFVDSLPCFQALLPEGGVCDCWSVLCPTSPMTSYCPRTESLQRTRRSPALLLLDIGIVVYAI